MPEFAHLQISPPKFDEMLRDAFRSIVSVTRHRETDFGQAERAQLAEGGFAAGAAGRARRDDPVARTVAAHAGLLSTALDVGQTAQMLGVDPSRIRQQLAEGSLYGIKVRGEWRLPSFQFDPPRRVSGVEEVLRSLPPDLHPVEVSTWFTTPDPDLVLGRKPVSPRDWLLSGGGPGRVAAMAKDL